MRLLLNIGNVGNDTFGVCPEGRKGPFRGSLPTCGAGSTGYVLSSGFSQVLRRPLETTGLVGSYSAHFSATPLLPLLGTIA